MDSHDYAPDEVQCCRFNKGEDVWAVGVDKDQHADGLLTDGTSVVLTSALKQQP